MSSSVQVCFQAGAGRGHRSGMRLRPGVRSAWSVPTSVLSDEARNPSALQGKGGASSSTDAFRALAPALSGATRHPGVRVSDRTCSLERRGAGATWVDLGTPRWLKCDSVGIDLRPCVRPRKGQRDGGLRLPGPRTDVRGGGGGRLCEGRCSGRDGAGPPGRRGDGAEFQARGTLAARGAGGQGHL